MNRCRIDDSSQLEASCGIAISEAARTQRPFGLEDYGSVRAMAEEFPKDVKEFISQHVHSLAQLEVLLMLHRDQGRSWTPEQITSSLYLERQMVEDLLADLVGRGFAAEENSAFRYKPAGDVVHGLIERLAKLYQERRVTVISEIFAKPADSARAFAEAFRLRGKE